MTRLSHALTGSNGFGKEHFELITQKYSLIKLEHYLRWVANEGAFAKNINDLADEGSGKLVELTIKYECNGHSRAAQAISAGTTMAANTRNGPTGIFKCT